MSYAGGPRWIDLSVVKGVNLLIGLGLHMQITVITKCYSSFCIILRQRVDGFQVYLRGLQTMVMTN